MANKRGLTINIHGKSKYQDLVQLSGWLWKKKVLGATKRYFILKGQVLAYFEKATDNYPLSYISVRDIQKLEWNNKKQTKFELTTPFRSFIFSHSEKDEAQKWFNSIQKAHRQVIELDAKKHKQELNRAKTPKFIKENIYLDSNPYTDLSLLRQKSFDFQFYESLLPTPDLYKYVFLNHHHTIKMIKMMIDVLLSPPTKEEEKKWSETHEAIEFEEQAPVGLYFRGRHKRSNSQLNLDVYRRKHNNTRRPSTIENLAIPADFEKLLKNKDGKLDLNQKRLSSVSILAGLDEAIEEKEQWEPIERVLKNKVSLYRWIMSDKCMDVLLDLFTTTDFKAQRKALWIIWLICGQKYNDKVCRQKFAEIVRDSCGNSVIMKSHQKLNNNNALLTLLVTEEKYLNRAREYVDFCKVANPGVWGSVFANIMNTDFYTRRTALKDVNGILIGRQYNCKSLLVQNNWQHWIFRLLYDVPKRMEHSLLRQIYQYTMNIFTLLYFHSLYKDPPHVFKEVITPCVREPSGGFTAETLYVPRSTLISLMIKLTFNSNIFEHHCFDQSIWPNLKILIGLIMNFLFKTPNKISRTKRSHNTEMMLSEAAKLAHEKQDEKKHDGEYGIHEDSLDLDVELIDRTYHFLKIVNIKKTVDDLAASEEPFISQETREAIAWFDGRNITSFFRNASAFVPLVQYLLKNHSAQFIEGQINKVVEQFFFAEDEPERLRVFRLNKKIMAPKIKAKRKSELKASKKIEQDIEDNLSGNCSQLLLLGAGESGKSTLFKQMIELYGGGFKTRQLENYKRVIHQNILASLQELIYQSKHLTSLNVPDLKMADHLYDISEEIASLPDSTRIDEELGKTLSEIWADKGIKNTYEQRSRFQLELNDSGEYFFDKIKEVSKRAFIPKTEHLLRARVRTSGVVESTFSMDGNTFKMFDVGGQRNERKKWLHLFDCCTAIIFVAAISEYDQVLYEDEKTNRIDEAIDLFDKTCNNPNFADIPIILFLNKSDLFKKKLEKISLAVCFPDKIKKKRVTFREGCLFMRKQFTNRNRNKSKEIFTHVTCATQTKKIKDLFNDNLKHIIIGNLLDKAGLLA